VYQTTNNVIARMNLRAPSAPEMLSPAQRNAGVSLTDAPGGWGTSSKTSSNGSSPGALGGSPPSAAASMPSLSTLSPTARTALKVVPFVAALFFFNKGDNVLGAVSVAAGVGALAVL